MKKHTALILFPLFVAVAATAHEVGVRKALDRGFAATILATLNGLQPEAKKEKLAKFLFAWKALIASLEAPAQK